MTSTDILTEQVNKIKIGDRVTARFDSERTGEFTVTGNAYNTDGQALSLAGWNLRIGDGPGFAVREIVEHTPAPRPLPTKPGSIIRAQIGNKLLTYDLNEDGGWYLDNTGYVRSPDYFDNLEWHEVRRVTDE